MGHDHSHGHSHDHSDANRTRLAWAFGITACILVAEIIGAIVTSSLALLVDAAHMLTDTLGLLLALTAANLIARKPTTKRTWGFRRAEVLSATVQSALLLAVGIYAAVDAVRRLFAPALLASSEMSFPCGSSPRDARTTSSCAPHSLKSSMTPWGLSP